MSSDDLNPQTSLLPLREPTFLILLSLAPGKKHGYAILRDVEELCNGKVKLSTGTLYEALARLLSQDLIERISEGASNPDDDSQDSIPGGRPRKAYRLTKAGRGLLEAETRRMQSLVYTAQIRLGKEVI
jgi:DNA-binding PadR family transcriptional regulator